MSRKSYKEVINYLKPADQRRWIVIHRFVKHINMVLILECLINRGFDPHVGIIHAMWDYGLAHDVCWILEPEIDLQTVQYFRSNIYTGGPGTFYLRPLLSGNDIRNIVHRFENKKEDLEKRIKSIIDHICYLMNINDEKSEEFLRRYEQFKKYREECLR